MLKTRVPVCEKTDPTKRVQESKPRRERKLKYVKLEEGWGEVKTPSPSQSLPCSEAKTTGNLEPGGEGQALVLMIEGAEALATEKLVNPQEDTEEAEASWGQDDLRIPDSQQTPTGNNGRLSECPLLPCSYLDSSPHKEDRASIDGCHTGLTTQQGSGNRTFINIEESITKHHGEQLLMFGVTEVTKHKMTCVQDVPEYEDRPVHPGHSSHHQHPQNASTTAEVAVPSSGNISQQSECNDDITTCQMLPSPPAVAAAQIEIVTDRGHPEGGCLEGGHLKNHRGTISSNKSNISDTQCDYKRGGYCRLHKMQGERGLQVSKKWGLLKSGLHGYVTTRKVTWTCRRQLFGRNVELFSTTREDLSSHQTVQSKGANTEGTLLRQGRDYSQVTRDQMRIAWNPDC